MPESVVIRSFGFAKKTLKHYAERGVEEVAYCHESFFFDAGCVPISTDNVFDGISGLLRKGDVKERPLSTDGRTKAPYERYIGDDRLWSEERRSQCGEARVVKKTLAQMLRQMALHA